MSLHPVLSSVTERIRDRSAATRTAYLSRLDKARSKGPIRKALGCTNLAHGFAAAPAGDKILLREIHRPNLAIVSSYNDMLSAHQPFERFPAIIKQAAREAGATAQFAGGVPAMCDGVTQGEPGMELSLFSRDVIALATAVALSHNMFDAALCLGICDKIVPGLLIGALAVRPSAGDLRARRADALGPVQRREGAGAPALRQGRGRPRRAARIGREVLPRPRHLHLLRHRQQQPDADGGDGPAPAGRGVRQSEHAAARRADRRRRSARPSRSRRWAASTRRSARSSTSAPSSTASSACWPPAARPTTPSTWSPSRARPASLINWDDFRELSDVVPLLARVYPNGKADVNHFHAAGGMGFRDPRTARRRPAARRRDDRGGRGRAAALSPASPCWTTAGWPGATRPRASGDASVLRPASDAVQRRRRPASC